VKVQHVGEYLFNETTFLREVAHRHPEAEAFRDGVLQEMGESAMTKEEAAKAVYPWDV
jgi:hypothetical protein